MRNHVRWITIAVIICLIMINYLDRSAISYVVAPLSKEFGISTAQYGFISGIFSVGYMVFAFASGPLVDRFGPRKILLLGIVLWSAVTALTPIAGGFVGLLLIRIVLGAGEGPAFPAATRVASRWLPRQERGVALALIGGVTVSGTLLIAGPVATQLVSALTWRGMFLTLAAAGVLWGLLAVWLLRDSPADSTRCSAREREHITSGQLAEERSGHQASINWTRLLTNRNLWIVGAGYFAWGFMFWGFMYWLPQFLQRSYGLSLKAVGLFSIAPWAAGMVGALLGGFAVDGLYRRTQRIRSRFLIMGVALLLAGAALIPILAAPSLVTALTFISVGVGCGFITGGIWWVAAIDADPAQPGAAAGFADAAFALSGVVAPSLMGLVVASTGTFTSGFVVMIALALVAALLMLLFTREPTRMAPQPVTATVPNPAP